MLFGLLSVVVIVLLFVVLIQTNHTSGPITNLTTKTTLFIAPCL